MTPEWEALEAKGATKQRCLWASTSTKNPDYRDVVYVEELVGPDTVNTMPRELVEAVHDHGEIRGDTLLEDPDEASRILDAFESAGVSYDDVVQTLEREGVEKFAKSFADLIEGLESKLEAGGRDDARSDFRRELGQQLRVDSVRTLGRRRLGPPDVVDVRRRPDGGADRRPPAAGLREPGQPGQRPPDLLQGPRVAAVLRGPEGGRARSTTRSC